MSKTNNPAYRAFVVKEYGEGKAHWTEIGVVWEHKQTDGFTLDITEGIAVSGRVVLLPPKDKTTE
jgi:hypothetical protein